MPRIPVPISLATGFVTLLGASAHGQLFTLGPGTNVYAVSADGSTVAGPAGSGHFRWTRLGGVQPLPLPASATIKGLSGDGSTVFGQSVPLTAFRYDGSTTFYPGVIPAAISRDGLVMTGQDPQSNAVRWSVGAPAPVRLSASTSSQIVAHAINADGSVIVGESNGPAGNLGMVWTAGGGVSIFGPPTPLPLTSARFVTGDGLIHAGWTETANGSRVFRRGPNGAMEMLPTIEPETYSRVSGLTDDGQTLVGNCGHILTVWRGAGVQSLDAFLAGHGITTPAGAIWTISGISADGRVLAGQGMFNGQLQGWVAIVPAPGTAGMLVIAALAVPRRRRRVPGTS